MPKRPALKPEDFAFTTKLPATRDIWKFSEEVGRALLQAAGVKAPQNVSLSSSMSHDRPANGLVGVNVLSVKKKGPAHEFGAVQAIFDAKGNPKTWSHALDPDGDPKRPDVLRVMGLNDDDVKRVKAINLKVTKKKTANTAKKKGEEEKEPFALEAPASRVEVAGGRVAMRCKNEVHFFDTTGAPVARVKMGGAHSLTFALSSDGQSFVTGLKKLDVFGIDGARRATLEGHPRGEVSSVAFSADGSRVASASFVTFQGGERSIAVFEVATSKTLARRSLTEGPTFIAFTGAEGLFVARDEAVLRFDAKLEQRGERRFERASWLRPVGVVGNRLLVVNRGRFEWLDDKTLASKPLKVPALPEHGQSSFALSADGSRLLVVVPSVEAKKWVFTVNVHLLSTGQQLASTRLEVESAPDVARFLSNDRMLVGGGRTFAILPLQPEPGSGQK